MGVDPGPRDLCSPNFWSDMQMQYAGYCASKIGQYFDANFKTRAQGNSCPIPTSLSAVGAACVNALRANSSKDVWVGPQSEYCKKQKREDEIAAALNPCDTSKRKKVDAGGKTIEIVEPNCAPRFGGGADRIIMNPGEVARIPFQSDFSVGAETAIFRRPNTPTFDTLPSSPSTRLIIQTSLTSVPVLPPVSRRPIATGPAKGGGSGGSNTVRLDNGSRIKMPTRIESSRVPVVRAPVSGPGSGGSNMVRPSSAMDRLGTLNTDSGLGGVAGTAGGAQLGVRPAPRPTVPGAQTGGKPKVDPCAPPVGCGGSNMISGSSGNSPTRPSTGGSGGSNMVSGSSGNSPTTRQSGGAIRPSGGTAVRPSSIIRREPTPAPYNATINPR